MKDRYASYLPIQAFFKDQDYENSLLRRSSKENEVDLYVVDL